MSKFISLNNLSEFLTKCKSLFYTKPNGGVPKTDLAQSVQTSLGKADSAYQKPNSGIPKTDLASSVQSSLDLADSSVQAEPVGEVSPVVEPYDYATKEEVSQLGQKVSDISTGKYYGYYATASTLPGDADVDGFAYVGSGPTYTIYNCRDGVWTSSNITVNQSPIGNGEDINQDEDGKLQFADRIYNAQQPNGMGYVILRKNKTFAEQVTEANTIYEIRYDFDLNGASVSIPEGCELKFVGGKLENGSIVYDGTLIDGDYFGKIELSVSGTILGLATPQMFGAKADGISDDTQAFLSALNSNSDVYVPSGEYSLESVLVMPDRTSIRGDGRKTIIKTIGIEVGSRCVFSDVTLLAANSGVDYLIRVSNEHSSVAYKMVKISNIYFRGSSDANTNISAVLFECVSNGLTRGFHSIILSGLFSDGYFARGIGFRYNYLTDIYLWISDITVTDCFFYAAKRTIEQITIGEHTETNAYLGGLYCSSLGGQTNRGFTENFAVFTLLSTATFSGCRLWDATSGEDKFVFTKRCNSIHIYDYGDIPVYDIEFSDIDDGETTEQIMLLNNIVYTSRRGELFASPQRIQQVAANANLNKNANANSAASFRVVEMIGVKDYTGATHSGHAIIFGNSSNISAKVELRILFIDNNSVLFTASYKGNNTEIILYPLIGNLQTFRKPTASLPDPSVNIGSQIFDTTRLGPVWSNGNGAWVDGTGTSVTARHSGTTAQRPTKFIKDGFVYLDTSLGKLIWYIGGSWYDATGSSV